MVYDCFPHSKRRRRGPIITDCYVSASRLRALAQKWISEQAEYPNTPEGKHAAAAVILCAKELLDEISKTKGDE